MLFQYSASSCWRVERRKGIASATRLRITAFPFSDVPVVLCYGYFAEWAARCWRRIWCFFSKSFPLYGSPFSYFKSISVRYRLLLRIVMRVPLGWFLTENLSGCTALHHCTLRITVAEIWLQWWYWKDEENEPSHGELILSCSYSVNRSIVLLKERTSVVLKVSTHGYSLFVNPSLGLSMRTWGTFRSCSQCQSYGTTR